MKKLSGSQPGKVPEKRLRSQGKKFEDRWKGRNVIL